MALQLTRQNISALKNQIPPNELSQTFKDMILVSRFLDIQHVWINSLCIVQDNKGDWRLKLRRCGRFTTTPMPILRLALLHIQARVCFEKESHQAPNPA